MTFDRLRHGTAAEVAEFLSNTQGLSALELVAVLVNTLERVAALEARVMALSAPPTIEVYRGDPDRG